MKNVTNSFKQVINPAVSPGIVYLIGGRQHGKMNLKYFGVPDLLNTHKETDDEYYRLRDIIDQEAKVVSQRIRNGWLYANTDEVERVARNGFNTRTRPARSTLDNWRYSCITDNARSALGMGEN